MAILKIDHDILQISRQFAGTSPGMPKLLAAVERAEGNILKAVQCTYKETPDRQAALTITARSAVHAMVDYVLAHDPEGFVDYWATKWAPVGVANDPQGLNAHWPTNVLDGLGVKRA